MTHQAACSFSSVFILTFFVSGRTEYNDHLSAGADTQNFRHTVELVGNSSSNIEQLFIMSLFFFTVRWVSL